MLAAVAVQTELDEPQILCGAHDIHTEGSPANRVRETAHQMSPACFLWARPWPGSQVLALLRTQTADGNRLLLTQLCNCEILNCTVSVLIHRWLLNQARKQLRRPSCISSQALIQRNYIDN